MFIYCFNRCILGLKEAQIQPVSSRKRPNNPLGPRKVTEKGAADRRRDWRAVKASSRV